MEVRVVDQSSFWIFCSLMKPDQFATMFWFWKLLKVAMVDGAQELVPEVLSVTGGMIELIRCRRPLNRNEPRGWVCVPLIDQEGLNGVDISCIES
jgi:hypothetical protein